MHHVVCLSTPQISRVLTVPPNKEKEPVVLCHLSSKVFSLNKWKKKKTNRKLANSYSDRKQPLKHR